MSGTAKSRASAADVRRLERVIEELRGKCENQRATIDAGFKAEAARVAETEKLLRETREENAGVNARLDDAHRKNAHLQNEVTASRSAYERQIASLEHDNARLTADVESLSRRVSELQMRWDGRAHLDAIEDARRRAHGDAARAEG